MKQLNTIQSALFLIGGVLMVIGAGCFVFMFAQQIVCWIFLVGALLFAAMQVNQAYEGHNPTIKRLKKIMTFADIFFVLAGLLMVDSANMWLKDYFADTITYFNVVYNKWVLLLLAAAILEMYSMHRIASELKKDAVEDEADNEEQDDAPATDRQ
ncbi:MAG: hypothetical protein EGR76_07600 [Prevotella stercorea]|nr:hypothetical protein [Leyella stercorea]MBD8938133.1 hypothetical protein [Leyella stercorea]